MRKILYSYYNGKIKESQGESGKMVHLNKERVIMLTEYFLTNDKPVTVKQIQQMFEQYSGEKVRRQTIYDDLNAIDVVIGLKREHSPDQRGRTLQWSKSK
jgi:hypothetical protein